MIRIAHGRTMLALHVVREAAGPRLLLLHGLGESAARWTDAAAAWPGAAYALDFSGHGSSDPVPGGAYHPELLAADADAALATLGASVVAGAGLGAYVALLVAGARREIVPAALLLPGAGLEGGGPAPGGRGYERALDLIAVPAAGTDPLSHLLDAQVRPSAYAEAFAGTARRLFAGEDGGPRPAWWLAVRPHAQMVAADAGTALADVARAFCL